MKRISRRIVAVCITLFSLVPLGAKSLSVKDLIEKQWDIRVQDKNGIKTLNLKEFGLTSLEGLLAIENVQTVENIFLMDNKLEHVRELKDLSNLKRVWLGRNGFSNLPEGLCGLTQLTKLCIENNELFSCQGLEKLTNLSEKLCLHGNNIVNLDCIRGLKKLTSIDVAFNLVRSFEILKELPALASIFVDAEQKDILDLTPGLNLDIEVYMDQLGCIRDNEQGVTLCKDKVFVTVADKEYYPWLLDLIGSIHKTNLEHLKEILVYDLGFTCEQRAFLKTLKCVNVYDVEMTHPDLKKQFVTDSSGKQVRGWYAWKPVILKQALEKYDYILFLDAGCTVGNPLDDLFSYIQEKGYFLLEDTFWGVGVEVVQGKKKYLTKQFKLFENATEYVMNYFDLDSPTRAWIAQKPGIIAGVQGLSRKVYKSYVYPMYECSKNLALFADDGTCVTGFGHARHDQTVFSIQARSLELDLTPAKRVELNVAGKPFNICCKMSRNADIFFACKGQQKYTEYLQFK